MLINEDGIESFKWAHQRLVFGKPLIEQPVIRQKFAAMFAKTEALQVCDSASDKSRD